MPNYLQVFEQYKRDLLGAITDEEFTASPGGTANSVAVIIRHLSGNFASRFTDFLTSDGEKPWREREAEFQASVLSRQEVMAEFERAWGIMRGAVASLTEDDLSATITIRGKPLQVDEALLRSVTHFASHVGQVIQTGKQFRGDSWEYLSIPPGESSAKGR